MLVVADIEANSLDPDKIWIIVCREVDNPDKVHIFERPDKNPKPFLEFSKRVTGWIGHYFLGFDLWAVNRLVPGAKLDPKKVIDTLVVSRVLNYNLEGGHSLEAWGERLGVKKVGTDITDWTKYTAKMRDRCISDTLINVKLYQHFLRYIENPSFEQAFRTEHNLQILCRKLHDNGIPFDVERAKGLRDQLQAQIDPIDKSLAEAFPPKPYVVKEVTPKLTKKGTLSLVDFRHLGPAPDLTPYSEGASFSVIDFKEFNPGSVSQIVERLNEAGWKPTEKTKGHLECERNIQNLRRRYKTTSTKQDRSSASLASELERLERFKRSGWKVSEQNLRTLPSTAPEAAWNLATRIILSSRLSDLDEWLALAVEHDGGYWIHGNFNHIGAWTGRMSHNDPNTANIPVRQDNDDTPFEKMINVINDEMRACFKVLDGEAQIGVDADGIQMRVFAHYVKDERLINALVSGDKKLGTDIHTLHQGALGPACRSRGDAKTFIYAWLLGAGNAKVAEILGCSLGEAKTAVENFIEFYPGLKELKRTQIPSDARRGYFIGLDGRPVVCDSEHLMLAGYLQNGEKVIMAGACNQWNEELTAQGIPYRFMNFVHDEWQVACPDSDNIKATVSEAMTRAIVDQGNILKLNCPLAAQAKFGYNWHDTH